MSKHMKRLNAPRAMRINRKQRVWTVRGSPGPHTLQSSIPLAIITRDYLGLCDTLKEAKDIIAHGELLVDGKQRKHHKYPCGFMDVLSIPKMKKDYRIVYNQRGKLTLVPVSSKDAEFKLCRIENKTTVKQNKTQLALHDGSTMLVDKDEYNTGDVLHVMLKDKKIKETYPFKKGSLAMIIGGSHVGQTANIEDIAVVASSRSNLATMKSDHEFMTITHYVFPIGKTKPVIQLPEVKME